MTEDEICAARDRWLARTPADRADAGPAAIRTCAAALTVLTGRLEQLGYPVTPMLRPCGDVDAVLEELGDVGPPVPPALVEVWRTIGEIVLVDLDDHRHGTFWEERVGGDARTFACDGLVIEGACDDEGWVGYVADHVWDLVEQQEEPAFPISPDGLHKDGTGGGGPYELVPDLRDPWMARLREFAWSGPTRPSTAPDGSEPDLVSYLRTAVLECGGFPGLHGSHGFEPIRRELVDGLPVF